MKRRLHTCRSRWRGGWRGGGVRVGVGARGVGVVHALGAAAARAARGGGGVPAVPRQPRALHTRRRRRRRRHGHRTGAPQVYYLIIYYYIVLFMFKYAYFVTKYLPFYITCRFSGVKHYIPTRGCRSRLKVCRRADGRSAPAAHSTSLMEIHGKLYSGSNIILFRFKS